jgi:hypothetical protein
MKNQKQRIKPMSKEKLSTDNLPPEQKESPEAWARLRKHLEAGDWTKCEADLTAMGLSPKLKNLFATAVAEERELGEIEAAGEGMAEKFEKLSGKLKFYMAATVKSLDECEKIAAQIKKTQADATLALIACEAAKKAARYRQYFHTWLPGLFGLPPVENPQHSGALSGFAIPPKLFQAGTAIKGQRRINFYEFNSWRDFDAPAGETPRRKYSTFGAQPATNPIH